MKAEVLPSAVLLLCWLAGVRSDNTPLVPSLANGTISISRTTSSTSQTSSDTFSITPPPTSRASGTEAVPTFTGDPNDLVDWCFSLYDAFLNASGSVSSETSSITETWTNYDTDVTTLTTFSTTYTFPTTVVPTPYTPPPDCFTGCVIVADRVRLEYWPTPRANGTTSSEPTITPAPVVSAVVDGMTLYSPSNYLVYTDLTALSCPLDSSPCTTIGEVVHEVTLSFGQNELLTENCFHDFDTFNYADFNTPIPWSIVSTQIGCTLITESHPGSEPDYGFTLMPNILFPQAVRTDVNPDWASCTFIDAAFDPPSALTPVHALTSAPPAPGTTPNPPVNPTPTVSPLPETTPIPPAPPASDPNPPAPSTIVDPSVPPADPPSSPTDPPVDSATQSNPADPGNTANSPPANPGTTAVPPNVSGSSNQPPPVPPAQSPTQGGSVGLIIGSIGGFNSPHLTLGSTITLPGQNPGGIPQAPIVTTVPGVVTSIGGILTTLPAVIPTESPSASPVTATIGGTTITIAPDGGSAVIGTQTVTAGGSPITVSSTVISLGPSGIIVGTNTVALASPTASGIYAGYNVTTATPSSLEQASIGSFLGTEGCWMTLAIGFLMLAAI